MTQRGTLAAVAGATWERLTKTAERLAPFVVVSVLSCCLFAITANWTGPHHIDAYTNALTAWYMGNSGSPLLPDHQAATDPAQRGNLPWIVDSPRGPVSQYPPGAALLAAPLASIWPGAPQEATMWGSTRPDLPPVTVPVVPGGPAVATAVLTTAAACGVVAAVAAELGASRRRAVAAGLIAAVATGLWGIASQQLWQHGPAALFLALGLLMAARNRFGWSGAMFGVAILIRPHTAVVAAGVGLAMSITRRSVRPAWWIGAAAAAGLISLLAFNHWLWGSLTVFGGYGDSFDQNLASADLLSYARNVALALVDPQRGLLVISPFLIVLAPGLRAGWRHAPDWARGAGVGAVLYLLIQYKVNRFSGGGGFVGYRYPIEALAASAPLLFLAWEKVVRPSITRSRWFGYACLISVVPQAIAGVMK